MVAIPFLSFAQMERIQLEEYLQEKIEQYTYVENEVDGEFSNVDLRTRVSFDGEKFFFHQEFSTVFKDDNQHRYTHSLIAVKPEDIVYQPIENLEIHNPYEKIPNAYQFVRLQLRVGAKIDVGYSYETNFFLKPQGNVIAGVPFVRMAPTTTGEMKPTKNTINDVAYFFKPEETNEKEYTASIALLTYMLNLVEMSQPTVPYFKNLFVGKWTIDPTYNKDNLDSEMIENFTFIFKEDGSFEEYLKRDRRGGKWTISGDSNFIKLGYDDGTVIEWRILKLTKDEMNLHFDTVLILMQKEG